MFGIVVNDLTTSTALDVANVAPAVAILSNTLLGVFVYFTRRFKALCLYFLPLMILWFGLMINFGQKGRNSSIADMIVCEVFVGLAFGALETAQTLALTVSSKRQDIPIVLFLLSACSIVANVVGSKVSDAIKRSMFLPILRDALPENSKSIAESLYDGGDKVQTTYPVGSEIRTAVEYALGICIQRVYIYAIAISTVGFAAITIWRNHYLNQKQNKGVMI